MAEEVNILVACEFSGIVRDAFISKGHDAISCDLLDSERPGPHIQEDVRDVLRGYRPWDMLIAFPPCTYLTVTSNRWMEEYAWYRGKREEAIAFAALFLRSGIRKVCVENPVGVLSTRLAKPTQVIHPWQFGHPEQKRTCLWLIGLPKLVPTNVVTPTSQRVWSMARRRSRSKDRSRMYEGIAQAMAEQWG